VHAFIDWIQEVFRRDNLPACRRAAMNEARSNALVESARIGSVDKLLPHREPVEA
jgi:hypothetical protein